MSFQAGDRVGPYEIVGHVGSGGMGEVYRARDSRLNRDVAIKILPELFAADTERLARFTREAQTLAALNHPNIAQIYGLEDRALVMELVEGEDLSQAVARGAIPLEDALPIARQIADALDAAHQLGIVHRDLKPANIKLRSDETVKVLDFGLAKLAANESMASGGAGVMNSPTMTTPTQVGVILGTAAYMAPEQAKGKAVDKRADIWAFGAVLFEMLTGQRLFDGETISEVLASVLKEEPHWEHLPANTPAAIRRLLVRCLEKDPKRRLHDIGDARLDLDEAAAPAAAVIAPVALARRSTLPVVGAGLAGALLAGFVMYALGPIIRPAASPTLRRLSVMGPSGADIFFDAGQAAISPDGNSVVFVAGANRGDDHLWLRPLDATAARPLAGTQRAILPFWSPDSRHVAFFSEGKLRRVSIQDGTVTTICDAKDGRGGSWSPGGVIVFAPVNSGPLMKVSANGGDPSPVTTLDSAEHESGHRFPWFLPDGRHFLFDAMPPRNGKVEVFAGSIDSTDRKRVMSAASAAIYADPGYLLFARADGIAAQRFDASRLETSGEPLPLGDVSAALGANYTASYAVTAARSGAMAYVASAPQDTRLAWLDLSGKELAAVSVPQGNWVGLYVSPDGRRAIAMRLMAPSQVDLWLVDLERGGARPLVTDAGANTNVAWAPDSTRIAYSSDRTGPQHIYVRSLGSSEDEAVLTSGSIFKQVLAWTPDGKSIVFNQLDPQTKRDVWVLPLEGKREPVPYLRGAADEFEASVSPDGRWLAYTSDESGQPEIYVSAFPTPGESYRVTATGATGPLWLKGGKQIVYGAAAERSASIVDVLPGATFRTGPPHSRMTIDRDIRALAPAPDLSRFLAALPVGGPSPPSITIVFDWIAALRKQ